MTLMTDRRVRHMPVMENGSVVRIVPIGEIVKVMSSDQAEIIRMLESYIHGTP